VLSACRNLFVQSKPDQLVVQIEIEPGLIKGHDVVPGSLLLTLQNGQRLWRECHPIQPLSLWQKVKNPSKMGHLKTERFGQPLMYRDFREVIESG
jgi:hypothetical protein